MSRRLTVAEYHRLIEVGVLTEKDRVELLEGNLVLMTAQAPAHSDIATRAMRTLVKILPDAWQLRSEQPITLPDSEPQADIALAR